jgi:hypothetical protein
MNCSIVLAGAPAAQQASVPQPLDSSRSRPSVIVVDASVLAPAASSAR